jgi:hypothetical protein
MSREHQHQHDHHRFSGLGGELNHIPKEVAAGHDDVYGMKNLLDQFVNALSQSQDYWICIICL